MDNRTKLKKCTDQLGRIIQLDITPQRIISIVPSQTEFLYDIGLGEHIVGQTLFCIHPSDKFKNATKIGGTKKLNIEKIRDLKPDIIIANKEENEKEQVDILSKEIPVWISDIKTLKDATDMMYKLGVLFNKEHEANHIINGILEGFARQNMVPKAGETLYLIWRNPWMAAGRDTFIHHLMKLAGYENAMTDPASRYPELSLEAFSDLNPARILLSSEPYPFEEKHIQELQQVLPSTRISLVDGEMFSWYGSRLLKAADYFRTLN